MDTTQLGGTASSSGSKPLSKDQLAGVGAWTTGVQISASADCPTRTTTDDAGTAASRPYTSLLRCNGLNSNYLMKLNDRANMNLEFDGGPLDL
jgi:hypothetical protein